MSVAGTLTVTETGSARKKIRKYTLVWVSSAGGAVTENYFDLHGTIERVVFIPGTGGLQPSDAYDVTLSVDADGLDLLGGQGANLSQTTKLQIKPGVAFKDGVTTSVAPISLNDRVQLVVAAAGDANGGTINIYVS